MEYITYKYEKEQFYYKFIKNGMHNIKIYKEWNP